MDGFKGKEKDTAYLEGGETHMKVYQYSVQPPVLTISNFAHLVVELSSF